MSFSHPSFFYLLLLIFPMLAVDFSVYRNTFLTSPIFVNNRRLANRAFFKSTLLSALLQLAFVFAVTAAAGPSWGNRYTQEEKQYIDVILAVDVSRSMLMKDVYPSRIDHTASIVRSILVDDPGIRYSLTAIRGGAFELVPMTSDRDSVRLASQSLSPGLVSAHGTDLGESLKTLPLSFPKNMQTEKVVFLFSDGVDGISERREVADIFKKQKITVYCVSVGTQTTEPLTDEKGELILYRNRTVAVPVETDDLRFLAAETGGEFFQSEDNPIVSRLRQTLKQHSGDLDRKSFVIQNRDDSGWFALAAFAALCCWYLVRVFLWRKEI